MYTWLAELLTSRLQLCPDNRHVKLHGKCFLSGFQQAICLFMVSVFMRLCLSKDDGSYRQTRMHRLLYKHLSLKCVSVLNYGWAKESVTDELWTPVVSCMKSPCFLFKRSGFRFRADMRFIVLLSFVIWLHCLKEKKMKWWLILHLQEKLLKK